MRSIKQLSSKHPKNPFSAPKYSYKQVSKKPKQTNSKQSKVIIVKKIGKNILRNLKFHGIFLSQIVEDTWMRSRVGEIVDICIMVNSRFQFIYT